ncbi:anaerobic ribonucleoside-triphosphate reductase [Candidatus Providencia siddallii]|uniref:Anaerobic ribonucleoside-triphosphate reductase n=1 Tax=Candidatus Providencia siddallii TaxID=1715285 RepID=A0ABP1CFF6_9GAMM
MNTIVLKKDKRQSMFNLKKIQKEINIAAFLINIKDDSYCNQIINDIKNEIKKYKEIDTNKIKKIVKNHLINSKYKNLANAYIIYIQNKYDKLKKQNKLMNDIKGLIEQNNISLLNENANKDSKVIPTQRDLLAGIIAKYYAKEYILPKDIVTAHEKGEIHYHDLDYAPFFPMFNCMIIDLEGMLTNGFKMGNAEIETPKSISTATAITAQIIAQVASHIYGGTTINRIDEILSPYVLISYKKHLKTAKEWGIKNSKEYAEKSTEKECYNAFQSLEYEVNTLHTANGQTPFVTFGFGLGESKESRLIQKSILKNRIVGLGKNRKTAIFPKLVFAIKKGLNYNFNDKNYDIKQLALECASKRMYPDILNYDRVIDVTGSFKTPMGCRSFLGIYKKNGKKIHDGRNNLGVISLNLPRIAIESQKDESKFWHLLDKRLLVAKKALMTRIERLKKVKARVAPILYMEGACGVRLNPDDSILKIFQNGRASISLGYIGLHETINALYGINTHIYNNEYLRKKAIDIVKKLRKTTDDWKRETGYAFSLYSTPSENLCNRFCRLDKFEFGIIQGVTDKGYYTNSFHLDVEKHVNPYEKINFEKPYPYISNGGFICYGEYPNLQHNLKALEDIWDYSYNYVPYYGTNTPIDECYECKFTGEFLCTSKGFVCPNCGNYDSNKVSVIRRVCGYLGSPDSRPFNYGKQEEVKRRIKHFKSFN